MYRVNNLNGRPQNGIMKRKLHQFKENTFEKAIRTISNNSLIHQFCNGMDNQSGE